MLPSTVDSFWSERELFEEYCAKICPAGGPSVKELLEHTDGEFADFAPVLKLASPSKSLVNCYEQTDLNEAG